MAFSVAESGVGMDWIPGLDPADLHNAVHCSAVRSICSIWGFLGSLL